MKLRNVALGALGSAGLIGAANRLLGRRADGLDSPLDGETNTYRWRGFDVAYVEAGDPDDPDVCLFHGINASGSGHEFRGIFDALAEDYHVLVPDMPGFGRSDRPPLLYSGSLYTTFVGDFLADVTENPTVVGASLSGAYAAVAAEDADVEELILVCPDATTFEGRRPLVRSLVRTPLLGTALYNLATCKPAIRYFNTDHGYYDAENVTDELVDYQWATAHQPGARFAPASFFGGFLDLDADVGETLANLDVPVTLVWGRQATVSPLEDGEALAQQANARLLVFDESDVQPHVEHADQFVRRVVHGEEPGDATSIEIEVPGESDPAETEE
ncbi:alpha/beta fold hydrolase [Halorientalis pallida]|uniref:Alpha/beta hydrolase n=1 Tax=Halorientalis pallida TaxID=2479928 RepID=A0A498L4J9_9EURY|nr:alpha/beta hydrolase [Halorientalis pallida]RXK49222.1 alpha/beta hydrolase [Halorientalis pallida]